MTCNKLEININFQIPEEATRQFYGPQQSRGVELKRRKSRKSAQPAHLSSEDKNTNYDYDYYVLDIAQYKKGYGED
ncbi:uncharacterized protein Dyak_GE27393 [Drosophila yakuba]|uniref:Uncharacterized protein n=1 Tax=Drosophila yakuba TaxID=7245 RepID=A0A0R1E2V1_DROYA|nr:uncharacterized protein Dyak_GE27393 [Drosophila yakuba]